MYIAITKIYTKPPILYNDIPRIINKPRGIGFIANIGIRKRLLEDEKYYLEFIGKKHKTPFGDVFIMGYDYTDGSIEVVAADKFDVPAALLHIVSNEQTFY